MGSICCWLRFSILNFQHSDIDIWRCSCIAIGPMYLITVMENIHPEMHQDFMTGGLSFFVHLRWWILVSPNSLLMGSSCLWGGWCLRTSCPPGNLPSLSHFADQWYFDGCIWAFQPYVCLAIGRTRDGILQCWYWIWEVSTAISHIILETKPPVTSVIMSICPPHDGHRILVGDEDGIVRMWVIGYCMIILWKNGSHHIRAMCWILGCSYLGDCRALGYCIFAKRQPDVEVIALYGVIYLLSINISIMVQGRLVLADKERTWVCARRRVGPSYISRHCALLLSGSFQHQVAALSDSLIIL